MTDYSQNTLITSGDNRDAYESSVCETLKSFNRVSWKAKQPCSKYDFNG